MTANVDGRDPDRRGSAGRPGKPSQKVLRPRPAIRQTAGAMYCMIRASPP